MTNDLAVTYCLRMKVIYLFHFRNEKIVKKHNLQELIVAYRLQLTALFPKK